MKMKGLHMTPPKQKFLMIEYFISVVTQEPEMLGSLPEVLYAKPQNLLEDFTIIQDTIRKKLTT